MDSSWRLFIGDKETIIKANADEWTGKVLLTEQTCRPTPIGWSEVNPVQDGTVYKVRGTVG